MPDGSLVEVLADGSTRPFPKDETDWALLHKLTDAEIERAAATDPDNPLATPERMAKRRSAPHMQVKLWRRRTGLTQEEFAARYHLPLGTLRDWEQGKVVPDAAARAYLLVIAREPEVVARALESSHHEPGEEVVETVAS